jgi:hypothetical protein
MMIEFSWCPQCGEQNQTQEAGCEHFRCIEAGEAVYFIDRHYICPASQTRFESVEQWREHQFKIATTFGHCPASSAFQLRCLAMRLEEQINHYCGQVGWDQPVAGWITEMQLRVQHRLDLLSK